MFRKNVSLSSHSNYLIGGTAKFFYEAKTIPDLKESLLSALKDKQNIFLLGGGTNILFSDSGFDGLVIKPALSYIK
ncbi:MAG: UDP-N-acetylenolpyruvoylglucosamine reductase, partial [Patescibacteria group bacterium]